MKNLLIAFFLSLAIGSTAFSADYDLIIRNGRILDGTGNPAYFADVGLKDGSIVAIGKIKGGADREIDATGQIVAPGFIDVHSHGENIERIPLATNFLRMGVTSMVLGNCGMSRTDFSTYFSKLEEMGISMNVASLIGHGAVRTRVIGRNTNRAPTDEELKEMEAIVDEAMKAGAVGMSTGLIYQPGTFAKTDEVVALAQVVANHDGIYASHMRNEGLRVIQAIEEVVEIAEKTGVRAHISHIKASGNASWGKSTEMLELIERTRASGIDLTQDQYMYTASSTGISQLVPDFAREDGRDAFRKRVADPETKEKIVQAMISGLKASGRDSYEYAAIASYRSDRSLNGLRIPEAAKKVYGKDDLLSQIEMILEIEGNGGASGVFHGMSEDDIYNFLSHPNTMIAADSSVRSYQTGVPHPRGYGNNARVLARYVRDLEVLTLQDAIRRMTSLPATTFKLKGRGQIAEGYVADIVVFDPDTIQDNATFLEPHQYATGFKAVIVNGEIVVEDDEHNGARPGRIIRYQPL